METKEVDAERMLHLKFVRRLHQMRGTSLLSGVLIRLSALKEYEDSELTAARIAAALGMYIRKGDGQSYETDGNDSKENERELTIQPRHYLRRSETRRRNRNGEVGSSQS